jgi:proline iminopeptidase
MKKSWLFTVVTTLFCIFCSYLSCSSSVSIDASHSGYVSVDGGKLYYQVMGKGSPIIVVHGGPGLDQTYLLPQMIALGKKHQVVLYDQRYSGQSLPADLDTRFINMRQFVQDIESIRQTLGYKKIILIGHSWGGLLAMSYAINYPQYTQALILMNSTPVTSVGFDAFIKEFKQRMEPIQHQIDTISQSQAFVNGDPMAFENYCRRLFEKYLYKESDIQKISLNFSSETAKNQGKIEAVFSKLLFETKYDIRSKLNQLKIPTLVIHGEADPIPLWTAKQISKAIPHAQLIVVKKSGHFSYAEKSKNVFSEINHFIERLTH